MMPFVSPSDFPAAAKCTYLNSASVSLMYRGAEEATAAWQQDIAEFGTLNFDEEAEDRVFDNLRAVSADLVGARADDLAIGSSATELMASLAWAIHPTEGSNIVGVDIVFPSTMYPWLRVARQSGAEIRWVRADNAIADEASIIDAIDGRTAVVCLSHVEYASGQRYDLARIAEAAHAKGALVIIDATQSLGAVPFDIAREPVDAIVCGSYKWLCGPFGVGLLYLSASLAGKLDPGIVGWRSNKSIYSLQADRLDYPESARRFEFGTMAYGCAIGLGQSIKFLSKLGVDRIRAHNLALAEQMNELLASLGAEIVSPTTGSSQTSIVSARFAGHAPKDIVRALGQRQIIVSPRRDFVRFSFHLFNTGEDVDRVAKALAEIVGAPSRR
jgi:cysteine desulfurase/selenocysteine lyase